jgi:hypothetical protein
MNKEEARSDVVTKWIEFELVVVPELVPTRDLSAGVAEGGEDAMDLISEYALAPGKSR